MLDISTSSPGRTLDKAMPLAAISISIWDLLAEFLFCSISIMGLKPLSLFRVTLRVLIHQLTRRISGVTILSIEQGGEICHTFEQTDDGRSLREPG